MSGIELRELLEAKTTKELMDIRYQAVERMIELRKKKINMDKDKYRCRRKTIASQIRKISSELKKKRSRGIDGFGK